MPQTLAEYAETLDGRDLIWPAVPAPQSVRAKPSTDELPGIKAVFWDVYGVLLRNPEGKFTLFPEEEIRLQVALEKTIHEFNMWTSMYRKPGAPWESMIHQYRDYAERLAMMGAKSRGDFTAVNLVDVWRTVVNRLCDKQYNWDRDVYGDADELSLKIAYFFQRNLLPTEPRSQAGTAVRQLHQLGIRQGLLADGQPFTSLQLQRMLPREGLDERVQLCLPPDQHILSSRFGLRMPSKSLFEETVRQMAVVGIEAGQVLYVSCRLESGLVPAKAVGMKTALLATEKLGLDAPAQALKDPQKRPDRLLTDIGQISDVVGLG